MKTTIFYLCIFLYTISSQANVITLFSDGFEAGIPTNWTNEIVSGNDNWSTYIGGHLSHPASTHSGSYNAYLYTSNALNTAKTKIISIPIDLSNTENNTLTFWHAQIANTMESDKLKVYYKNSSTGSWIELASYQYGCDWTQRVINLPNPTDTYYIAFEGESRNGHGVCLDDVLVQGEEICSEPTNITITNITTSSAQANWLANGSDTWDIELIEDGASQTNIPTYTGITTLSQSFSNLLENTTYSFYIRSICGTDSSNWVGPYSFTTLISTKIENIPENNIFIFPNPASNNLQFTIQNPQSVKNIRFIDITGTVVTYLHMQEYKTNLSIDISKLKNGIYFIEITTDLNKDIRKLIVYK